MTPADRQRLRLQIDQARRARIDRENEDSRYACACPVCLGNQPGVHGEALYNRSRGCRCQKCQADRAYWVKRRRLARA